MPNEKFARPKRPVEKRGREDEELQKKKMAEFRSDSLDELLTNFEFAKNQELRGKAESRRGVGTGGCYASGYRTVL